MEIHILLSKIGAIICFYKSYLLFHFLNFFLHVVYIFVLISQSFPLKKSNMQNSQTPESH